MKKCLVIGAVIADAVMNIDHVPLAGEDISASSLVIHAGGCAYNVACVLQEFEIPATLLAPIGNGMYGEFIRAEIAKRGMEAVCYSEDYDSGYSLCLIDKTAERTFINIAGAELHFKPEWLEIPDMSEYDTIYMAGYEIENENFPVIMPFLKKYKDSHKIYFAPGPAGLRLPKPYMSQILELHPVLHLNAMEAMYISGETEYKKAADRLFELTGSPVIITLGQEGCYVKTKQDARILAADRVEAVDSNGAGDAHIGTVIAMRKKNYTFFDAARVGNYVSAQIVRVNAPNLPLHSLKM